MKVTEGEKRELGKAEIDDLFAVVSTALHLLSCIFFILLCSTLVFIARFYALSPGSLQHPAWVLRSKLVLDPGLKFSIHYNVRKTIKTSSLSCFELNQLWSDLFPVFIVLFWTNKKLKNQIQSWTRWKLHLFFEGNCHLMIELPQKVKRKIKTVMHWRLKLCY